ncbi:MAG: carboxypeptidase M32 [Phycisphaerae bacterium]|nr:carboxypeptidase M32 [Phycisphaerae bacterium]
MSAIAAELRSATRTHPYQQLVDRARESSLLSSTGAILGWDQETMMPDGGLDLRSKQLAQLARMAHELTTDPRVGEWLAACEADAGLTRDPTSVTAVNVREIRRSYDRATKLPSSLVEEFAQVTSIAQHEWAEARKANDFARFRPHLERIVGLLRKRAECFGWNRSGGEAWDALADEYEPGSTAKDVEAVFVPLRERLARLVSELLTKGKAPPSAFNESPVPIEHQERFAKMVTERLGFDFKRGRLDCSTHPFCGGSHCNDVRMTSRYSERCVNDGLGSAMHETGHGMYEQGLLYEHVGTPMGEAISLGIHESQSRMWENQVGRSRAFWTWAMKELPSFAGDSVKRFSLDEFYGAANVVEPGFIRVDADEATYNLHVMIRFEIERAVLRGDLEVAGIPSVWNRMYKEYLGLDVPDDRRGCLQDIHWSMGSMGYFPTYTLGNLYAAQFFEAALKAMPDLPEQFARGDFTALKSWLNTNIHAQGKRYLAKDLCKVVTGWPLSAEPLMRHLEGKLRPLYGV